ncbi:unnamed protein product [Sphagnum troendelagicum]|uniref:Uncharacterized protein n=1 Tax=Sphagnum troendelagicum TaxID=128251 RepID=A0ABP0TKA3_9BRYO
MDSEGCYPPSFLDVLDLQHWTHLSDAAIAHEEKGLQMLEEIRDKLHDMILADGSIEDLDNKIRVIEMASPNANTGNANTPDNDVMMSMPALFLKRKSLVFRLPRPEAGIASIQELCEEIQVSHNPRDKWWSYFWNGTCSPSVATQACGIAGICKEAQNVVVEQHKPVCTNICLMWQTWAFLFDETIKACWAQVMDGSQPLKCSKPLTPPIPSVLFDHNKCSIAEGVIIKTQQNLPTVFDQDAKVVAL